MRRIILIYRNIIPRGLQARHVSTQGERSEPWDTMASPETLQ